MADDDHLRSDHYAQAAELPGGFGMLTRRLLDHVTALCPDCRRYWDQLGALGPTFLQRVDASLSRSAHRQPQRKELSGHPDDIARQQTKVDELRRLRRRAQEELWELLRLAPEQRGRKIRRARRRFRSRMLAELLIEECRGRVHNQPAQAAEIVALVPQVLDWTRSPRGPAWAPALLARAEAHRANALRVSGDLPAADQSFIRLRRSTARLGITDPRTLADLASLEASLRIGQRRFPEAEDLLEQAALAFRAVGDEEGLARTQIKRANLLRRTGHPAKMIPILADTADRLRPSAHPRLLASTVSGRVNAFCDLGRFPEARSLLTAHLDLYELGDDPHTGAVVRCLEGRIALGMKDFAAAAESFASCRDAMLTLARHHDAAIAALYLAETYLAAGRNRDLRQLAPRLIAVFRAQGAAGETLAALRLLAQAVAAEALTAALLAELRQRVAAQAAVSG